MSGVNVKYCAIVNGVSKEIVLQESLDVKNTAKFVSEVRNVLQSAGSSLYEAQSTQKKDTSIGSLYYSPNGRGTQVIFLLTKPSFTYGRVSQLLSAIEKTVSASATKGESVQSKLIYDLLLQYDKNPEESFEKARTTIDSITSSVKTNIDQVMRNSVQLGDIEDKSRNLSSSSRGFLEQSKKVEQQIKSRRRKMYIMIATFVLILITFIIIFAAT